MAPAVVDFAGTRTLVLFLVKESQLSFCLSLRNNNSSAVRFLEVTTLSVFVFKESNMSAVNLQAGSDQELLILKESLLCQCLILREPNTGDIGF